MRRAFLHILARLATRVILLALVVGSGASRSARADCGHPVGARPDRFVWLNQLDVIDMAGSSQTAHAVIERSPLGPPVDRRPCSGLRCSSRDPAPVSTALADLDRSHQWVCPLGANTELDTKYPAGRPCDEPLGFAVGEKASIFHPPRG
jgi:hypothetical protein